MAQVIVFLNDKDEEVISAIKTLYGIRGKSDALRKSLELSKEQMKKEK
jgi:hypothetical protein|tara:strand:+ start:424 stop:567 length:144 start_codon:yes stop_codon:yes gene_type:complete